MKIKQVSIIEAILFASGEPVNAERLAEAASAELDMLTKIIELLKDRYEQTGSALTVLKLGGSYQLAVGEEYISYIKTAMETRRTVPLSTAAFEVLTIIAYNQPVTKGFVEHVRGVDSGSVVNSLVEKNLLEEAGRLDVPGRPITYKTTPDFLRCFQLSSLDDLPPLPSKDGQVSFDEINSQVVASETEDDVDDEEDNL